MKLDTKFARLRKTTLAYLVVGCSAVCLTMAVVFSVHVSVGEVMALSEDQLEKFAQNNILFYDPSNVGCVSGGYLSSICGDTAVQKYWSALRRYFDEEHTAAIVGNMAHEGDFNPVSWEAGKVIDRSGHFVFDGGWDRLYNDCDYSDKEHSCGVGVGALGITSHLSDYLQFVNAEAPDLIKYFQTPEEYAFSYYYPKDGSGPGAGRHYGDQALEVIGDADFNRLVDLEIRFVMEKSIGPDGFYTKANMFDMDEFKSLSSAYDAGRYWAIYYERCSKCGLEDTRDKRGKEAESQLALMSGFSCSGNGLTSGSLAPSTTDTEITLIGDSISVMSEDKLKEKFPNAVMTMVGSRHPTSRGFCTEDNTDGGLGILRVLASGSGVVAIQHQGQSTCETMTVDSSSLKKNVVWELGTNMNGANQDTIERVVELVGRNRNLYLVTPFNANSNFNAATDNIADIYRDIAKNHENVYIVDWNKAVRDNTSKYLDSGGYHPSSDGSKLLADLIAETIVSSGNDVDYSVCGGDIDTSGGLNEKQIERLMNYYNSPEVDDDYWSLPNGKDNCVSFSAFFTQRFTSIGRQPHRPWGNGKDVAHLIAMNFDLMEGNEPRPFAVFSTYDNSSTTGWGHTGVIVAIEGDDIVTLEAAYRVHDARIVHRTAEYFYNDAYGKTFTYLNPILNKSELLEVVGR